MILWGKEKFRKKNRNRWANIEFQLTRNCTLLNNHQKRLLYIKQFFLFSASFDSHTYMFTLKSYRHALVCFFPLFYIPFTTLFVVYIFDDSLRSMKFDSPDDHTEPHIHVYMKIENTKFRYALAVPLNAFTAERNKCKYLKHIKEIWSKKKITIIKTKEGKKIRTEHTSCLLPDAIWIIILFNSLSSSFDFPLAFLLAHGFS